MTIGIRTRLYLGFGALVALLAVITALAYTSMEHLRDATDSVRNPVELRSTILAMEELRADAYESSSRRVPENSA